MTTESEFLTSFRAAVSAYDTAVLQAIDDRLATLNLAITSFSPTSGTAGQQVTINGAAFGATQGTSTANMNSESMTIVSWSDTQIVADVVSDIEPGTQVPISVTTANGSVTAAGNFTINASTPTISAINPTSGHGGSQVTITGTGFGPIQGSSTVVAYDGSNENMPVVSWSDTQIVATVPTDKAAPWQIYIKVNAPGGQVTASQQFTID